MYSADAVEVGTEPVPICALGWAGVIIQNLGGQPVTLGPENVQAGKGLSLSIEDGWQPLPGGYAAPQGIGLAAAPLVLYGVTATGKATVAYLRHDLPPS